MVCPKLVDGTCRLTKKTCMQPYEIKMIHYKDCKIYKKGASKSPKPVRKMKPRKAKVKGRSKPKLRSK